MINNFQCVNFQSNGSEDLTPRKRPRKQQFNEYGPQAPKKFQTVLDAPIQSEPQISNASCEQITNIDYQNPATSQANASTAANLVNRNTVKTNNENSPPKIVDYYIKRPKTCNLLDVSEISMLNLKSVINKSITFGLKHLYPLQSYKTSWKSTQNHFQRYSDVKPREERRSTVVDLANQAHVLQKVNGWKIYHLTSQMEDLVSGGWKGLP